MEKQDDVGYGKPPVATRFVKGKSGNPRGRPKKYKYAHRSHRTHVKEDLVRLLDLETIVSEKGKKCLLSLQRLRALEFFDEMDLLSTGETKTAKRGQDQVAQQPISPRRRLARTDDERVRKCAHILDDLLLELQESVEITILGKPSTVRKQEALLLVVYKQATSGKTSAWKLLWAMFTHYGLDKDPDKHLRCYRLSEEKRWEKELRDRLSKPDEAQSY